MTNFAKLSTSLVMCSEWYKSGRIVLIWHWSQSFCLLTNYWAKLLDKAVHIKHLHVFILPCQPLSSKTFPDDWRSITCMGRKDKRQKEKTETNMKMQAVGTKERIMIEKLSQLTFWFVFVLLQVKFCVPLFYSDLKFNARHLLLVDHWL